MQTGAATAALTVIRRLSEGRDVAEVAMRTIVDEHHSCGSVIGEDGLGVVGTGEECGLGQDLGLPTASAEHGDAGDAGDCGNAGAGVEWACLITAAVVLTMTLVRVWSPRRAARSSAEDSGAPN